ncbi:MAG: ribonuclease J [Clostridiales bacterium]|nr:ribonuclease J [Clostridiales bacterium]
MKTRKKNAENIKQTNNKIKQEKQPKKLKINNKQKNILNPSQTTQKKENKKKLKIRFLGGVGEIGKNMTAIEYGKDIIVIDAGLTFPTDSMPGVDLVIPDVSYLTENQNKIRGIVITHGHEDHIGGLPYIMKEIQAPVFGTKLTLTLIENKLKEQKINEISLNCIKAGNSIKLGCFDIEFINVNHSIAGAVGLSITTPVGVIFHSGDFKIDFTPVNGETMDLPRISEIGKKGVLLMMADSTNIEISGTTISESVVKDTLSHVFSDNASRRLIIATFASNVHRLQQILDLAVEYKRKVAFSGRSMINIAEAASKIGELNIPNGLIIDIEKIKNYKDEQVLIISTGTQGEPMSALTRMASGEFNKVVIGNNDTVVISASVIPGNEKMIYGVINNLYRLGAEVIYESLEPIHASGHACQDELKMLHSLVNPKFFIPVHGEYRHLKKHARLAESLGMKNTNILIADIGDTVELTQSTMSFGEKFHAGSRFVDGIGIDEADSFVLRDRRHLSEDGLVVVVVSVNEASSTLNSLEIIGKGLVFSEDMVSETKNCVINALDRIDLKKVCDEAELNNVIRRSVKNYIFKATKKNPMILPVVMVV